MIRAGTLIPSTSAVKREAEEIGDGNRLLEKAGECCRRALDFSSQNALNKKPDAPRAHAGGMPEFVPTVPLRFAILPEASAVPRWHRSLCLIPINGRANCRLLIIGSA